MRSVCSGSVLALALALVGSFAGLACGASEPAPRASSSPVGPSGAEPPSSPASAPAPSATAAVAAAEPAPAPALAPAAKPARDAKRLHGVSQTSFIWPKPNKSGNYLGYIRSGSSVALKSDKLVKGQNCSAGFYEVEPRGFVCADRSVTLEPSARSKAGLTGPISSGAFPYKYAVSNGAPMYLRLPTPAEAKKAEGPLGPAKRGVRLPKYWRAHEELAIDDAIAPEPAPPAELLELYTKAKAPKPLRRVIPLGSMLAYTRAFEHEGRTWLLSADGTLVPADRVRQFKPSAFEGVWLDADHALPIAFFKKEGKPKWARKGDGAFEKLTGVFPVRAPIELTGKREKLGKQVMLETEQTEAGASTWLAEADAVVIEAEKKLGSGVAEGQKWVLVKITQGTLVAYVGEKPVFATLVSPGSGGVAQKGKDNVESATTPLGTFYVTFKDKAATMSPEQGEDRKFWIADVPHTQYFAAPFALHASYWHERFGDWVSAGCVNLSPKDAKALFDWTDPPIPEGWQGVTGAGAPENGARTAVVVRK